LYKDRMNAEEEVKGEDEDEEKEEEAVL